MTKITLGAIFVLTILLGASTKFALAKVNENAILEATNQQLVFDKDAANARANINSKVLLDRSVASNKIRKQNKLLWTELAVVKQELSHVKDYLNTYIPQSIVRLLPTVHTKREGCTAPIDTNSREGATCAAWKYPTEALVQLAFDQHETIELFNSDMRALQTWVIQNKALEDSNN